jgi:alkylation response protein AidB-like acyl-CoA dehydrogenase
MGTLGPSSLSRLPPAVWWISVSIHKPFEHIYRHHRRYRITEGSEEIQMRKVAAYLFGYAGPKKAAE